MSRAPWHDPARRPHRRDASADPTVPARRPSRPVPPPRPVQPPPGPAPAPRTPAPSKDSGWVNALLVSVIAVCLAATGAILLLGFWKPGFFRDTKLKVVDVQAAVGQILTDGNTGYGLQNVSVLGCNDGRDPTVAPGTTFTCAVTVAGEQRTVTVTIEDRDGKYGVSPPR